MAVARRVGRDLLSRRRGSKLRAWVWLGERGEQDALFRYV
ncbi:MAG: hypothetical protein A07HN63_02399 [uncultured archaeon A07HN63]|nr:MAG: hypothetical protein A07HN63_02399 [uncultured archaeon A07HN63]